jgi:hypothetical protein
MTLKFALAPSNPDDILYTQAGTPTLDLRFASSKSLVDHISGQNLIDFTRGGNGIGSYFDAAGTLRQSVVNLLQRSEEFDNASWNKISTTVSANTTTAPNETVTADTLSWSALSTAEIYQTVTLTAATYIFSVYARSSTGTKKFRLKYYNGTTDLFSTEFTATTAWRQFSYTITGVAVAGNVSIRNSSPAEAGDLIVWGAQLEQSSTVGEYVKTTSSISGAPRFDHNPLTGECLGLLVEEQRTNSIRNNTMAGAVAGTPGTLPTNWAIAGNGLGTLTQQVVGTGTVNGVTYVDVRFSGTTSNTDFSLAQEPIAEIVAANTQSWAASVWLAVVGGSTANILSLAMNIVERTSAGTFVAQQSSANLLGSLGSSLNRFTAVFTLAGGATVARIQPRFLNFSYFSGVPIDITLRIGLPQLEQGAFATSVIPTSGTAVTRSADVASIRGDNFSRWYRADEGCLFVDGATPAFVGTTGFVSINAVSNNNRFEIRQNRNNPNLTGASVDVAWTSVVPAPTLAANTSYKQATAFSNASHGNSIAGSLDTSSTVIGTIAATQLAFGWRGLQTAPTGGSSSAIRRLAYFDRRLPNATLQAITSSTPPTVYGNLKLDNGTRAAAIAGVSPTLDYRFAREKREIETVSLTDKLTYTGGNGTFTGSDGFIQRATTNVPRFDHDPLSRRSLGLLVEEQRTNRIRSNTMAGAVAGTPGTNPTNWIVPPASGNLTSSEIVGTGTESGITYVDVRLVTSGVVDISIYPEPGNNVTALNTQAWTHSAYVKLVGGSVANLTARIGVVENDSGGNFLAGGANIYVPTSALLATQRVSFTRTNTNASTAFVQPRLRFEFSGAGDITLRIGLPQLEQGAFATSVIPTSGTAVTRTADSAVIDGTGILTGTYTLVEKPAGCAVVSGTNINLQPGFTAERVMVFPAALDAGQITAIRGAM